MPIADHDREEQRDSARRSAKAPEAERSEALDWASAVGNAGVQRIARSPAGAASPVGPERLSRATGVLARQSEEEYTSGTAIEETGGGGGAEGGSSEPVGEEVEESPRAAEGAEIAAGVAGEIAGGIATGPVGVPVEAVAGIAEGAAAELEED